MTVLLILQILVPLVFAVVIVARRGEEAFGFALAGSSTALALTAAMLAGFDWSRAETFQASGSIEWLPAMGLNLAVGIDGVSALLIALTTFLGPICVLASRSAITDRRRMYYAWLLILQAAMVGVFAARDLILFYICFEFTLLPMFVLISVYGSSNRRFAAIKFFLYTFVGSLVSLAGLIYTVWFVSTQTGAWSLDIGTLVAHAPAMSLQQQSLVLLALMAGFAVKVPLFPVHTWLPLAHTEAPTAGSVILAGVLLKLGTYGIFRFALPIAPAAVAEHAPLIAVLAIIGIVYAGLICWVQTDVKKLVAYSSVSHLGFCVLGLIALNTAGLTGSVLYMVSHGLSTGALFLLIGMMYERYHTRSMREVGGLASKMPVWSSFMVFFAMASVGLPGLNGFPSELLCLIGTFQSYAPWVEAGEPGAAGTTLGPWFALAAGTGMVVAAIYLLYMVGRIVFGPLIEPTMHGHRDDAHEGHARLPDDLNAREMGLLLPVAALCLLFGLYPKPLLEAIEAPVNAKVVAVEEGAALAGLHRSGVASGGGAERGVAAATGPEVAP